MGDKKKSKPLRPLSKDKERDIKEAYFKESKDGSEVPEEEKEDIEKETKINEGAEERKEMETEEKQDETQEIIEALQKENEELKDKFIRSRAELDNMRRRTIKEKNELIERSNEDLLSRLLPVIDDLESAIESGKNKGESESLLKGVEMIYQKAMKTLEESGVKKMDDFAGKEFDVDYCDALMQAPSEDVPEGNVIQVVQPGYLYKDKVLRHAKVITSAGAPGETETKDEESN